MYRKSDTFLPNYGGWLTYNKDNLNKHTPIDNMTRTTPEGYETPMIVVSEIFTCDNLVLCSFK